MKRKTKLYIATTILFLVFIGFFPLTAAAAVGQEVAQNETYMSALLAGLVKQNVIVPAATGDEGHLFLFIGLLVVGIIGIAISIRILTKNRKKK